MYRNLNHKLLSFLYNEIIIIIIIIVPKATGSDGLSYLGALHY